MFRSPHSCFRLYCLATNAVPSRSKIVEGSARRLQQCFLKRKFKKDFYIHIPDTLNGDHSAKSSSINVNLTGYKSYHEYGTKWYLQASQNWDFLQFRPMHMYSKKKMCTKFARSVTC